MKTRRTALAAAVSSLSLLSACGGGGSNGGGGDGSVPDYTPAPVITYATSVGIWDGTVGDRTTSGVVTNEKAYWFLYQSADASAPAGFYSGNGDDAPDPDNGTGVYSSSDVKKFDFEGDTVIKEGVLGATYLRTRGEDVSPYTTANTLNGSFQGLKNGEVFDVEMYANVYFVAADGPLNMIGFKGTWTTVSKDPVTGLDTGKPSPGTWEGTTTIDGFKTTMHYTQSFTMNEAVGAGTLSELDGTTCTDNTGSACTGFRPALSGNIRNTPVNPADPQNDYKLKIPFTPADGWTGQWTLQVNKAVSNPDGSTSTQYLPMPFNVTLRAKPLDASISDAELRTNFNPVYEEQPLVAIIAGTYSSGWTGIGTTRYANASLTISDNLESLNIPLDGLVVGSEPASFCSYVADIIPHLTGGNFYDVTAITFSNLPGGTCPYTGKTFKGVITYDQTGTLRLMAKNTDAPVNTAGFMVVATKPQ